MPQMASDGIRLPQMASDRLRLLRWPQVAKFRNIGTTVFQNSGCQHFATSWNSKIHKHLTNTVRFSCWDNFPKVFKAFSRHAFSSHLDLRARRHKPKSGPTKKRKKHKKQEKHSACPQATKYRPHNKLIKTSAKQIKVLFESPPPESHIASFPLVFFIAFSRHAFSSQIDLPGSPSEGEI